LGCSETFDILVARGKEWRDEDTLGKATRPFLLDASREDMWRKYKEKEREKERKGWRMGSRAAARKGMKEKSGHSFWAKYIGQVRVTFDRIWMQSGIPDLAKKEPIIY
jgi:hypothetical protein